MVAEVELAFRAVPHLPLAGVTGSNGKSTTTALLGMMLRRRFTTWVGGNIGGSLGEISAFALILGGLKRTAHDDEIARQLGASFLDRYGGKISSEWFFSKALQILEEAPEVYAAADRLIEAGDWIVLRLTGVETRNACTAGYKAMWEKAGGFPSNDYFRALDPRFENVVDEKMNRTISPIGAKAGELTEEMAERLGLKPGTAVGVANVDAHVAVPAATVTKEGIMVAIMGTSTKAIREISVNVSALTSVALTGIVQPMKLITNAESCGKTRVPSRIKRSKDRSCRTRVREYPLKTK